MLSEASGPSVLGHIEGGQLDDTAVLAGAECHRRDLLAGQSHAYAHLTGSSLLQRTVQPPREVRVVVSQRSQHVADRALILVDVCVSDGEREHARQLLRRLLALNELEQLGRTENGDAKATGTLSPLQQLFVTRTKDISTYNSMRR